MAKRRYHHHHNDGLTMEQRQALFQVRIRRDIEQRGYTIMAIFGEGRQPSFAYTIGLLPTFGHPELLIMGLELHNAGDFLSVVIEKIRKGERFIPGTYHDVLRDGMPVYFGEITDPQHFDDYFGQGQEFHQARTFAALQVVWCDHISKTLPWQEGFNPDWQKYQRFLFGRNKEEFHE